MLTFDTIRDLERVEKQNKRLQKVPVDITVQLNDYLKRKEGGEKTSADLTEMENIKSTIKRFFELREGKILSSALDTIRTGLPPEHMTKEEEAIFYRLVAALKEGRERFFTDLNKKEEEKVMYRVKKTIPSFIGPDMKKYTLVENSVMEIPMPLNELLLKEGIIEPAK